MGVSVEGEAGRIEPAVVIGVEGEAGRRSKPVMVRRRGAAVVADGGGRQSPEGEG